MTEPALVTLTCPLLEQKQPITLVSCFVGFIELSFSVSVMVCTSTYDTDHRNELKHKVSFDHKIYIYQYKQNPTPWPSRILNRTSLLWNYRSAKSRKSSICNILHSNSKIDSPLIIVPLFLPSQISFIEPGLLKLNTCIGKL